MPKRTMDTDTIIATSKAFNQASTEFNDSVSKLKSIISTYNAANDNEAAKSVEQEWTQAQQKMNDVVQYLEKFGTGLNSQAQSLDATYQSLRWK